MQSTANHTPLLRQARGLAAGGFHALAWWEWGPADAAQTAVCVHGLTRQGRDFDALARGLVTAGWRVLCPDIVGRGQSGRLANGTDYGYPQYLADLNLLLQVAGVARCAWVGTSMGGLIGMMLAALAGTPITRLVINDIGPFVPLPALQRLAEYVGRDPLFPDMAAAIAYHRTVYAGFGVLSDQQWQEFTRQAVHPTPDGLRLHYDPRVGAVFLNLAAPIDIWPIYDAVRIPTLVLRGANSDLLLPETAAEMTRRGPGARLVTIADCGHAPALLASEQIAVVTDFLAA